MSDGKNNRQDMR
jgi:hypothetical protein